MISTIMTALFSSSNGIEDSNAIVTEFYEVVDAPEQHNTTIGTLDRVERITDEGVFHSYSQAKLVFDLGEYGEYPINLSLPRYPDEPNELEDFMDELDYDVADLPALEEGNIEFPFRKLYGEWEFNWEKWHEDE